MANDRAAVRNAADPQQVKDAGRRDKRHAAWFVDNLRAVMGAPFGRALMWELLGKARIYASVFHRDPGLMAYNSGRQDFGHQLLAEIIAADAALYLLMEREARERDQRDNAAVDAAQVPSVESQERSDA